MLLKAVLDSYAFITAINLIKNNEFKNCLIVCSETYTKYIKKNDRSTAPIFSDAASAFYINKKNLPSILSTFSKPRPKILLLLVTA